MRGRVLTIAAIAHAGGFVLVAAAIVATAIHLRREGADRLTPVIGSSVSSDPLARELARCQAIGMAAQDDAACGAAWAENRRRFFTYRPADRAMSPGVTGDKSHANGEGR